MSRKCFFAPTRRINGYNWNYCGLFPALLAFFLIILSCLLHYVYVLLSKALVKKTPVNFSPDGKIKFILILTLLLYYTVITSTYYSCKCPLDTKQRLETFFVTN